MANLEHNVRVVFTASTSWFGRMIRRITGSTVSHVFIEIPVWGGRFAVEATVGGTRVVPAHKSRHGVVADYTCLFPINQGLHRLVERLGTPYDWSGTFVLGLLLIWWRWLNTKVRRITWSTRAIKCSELAWYFLDDCELGVSKRVGKELASPEDILEYCEEHPAEFTSNPLPHTVSAGGSK